MSDEHDVILTFTELQPQVRGWLLASISGRKGLVPYNYIKVLGKRRGRQSQTSAPAAQPSAPSQPLSSAFSQTSISAGDLAQTTTDTTGSVPQEPSVPDMDSIFAGTQQEAPLEKEVGQLGGTDMSAADILKKATGE